MTETAETTAPRVSLIVSTYNWPEALDLVLDSARRQTWPNLEIIVADDGSGPATAEVVDRHASGWNGTLVHAWQEDQGFRLAACRNLAVARATGDYLLFVDGDCLLFPTFVENHMRRARPGWFTAGRRCYLRRGLSRRALAGRAPLHIWSKAALFPILLFGGGTRAFQLVPVRQSDRACRKRLLDADQAQGCNLGLWRSDYLQVGGFNEDFKSWGGEDTELVLRLFMAGLRRLTLNHADPVLHLWHPRRGGRAVETVEPAPPEPTAASDAAGRSCAA